MRHLAQGVKATANIYQGAFGQRGATVAGTEYTFLLDEASWPLMFLATARIQGHEAQRKGNSLYLGFSEAQEQSLLSKPQGLTKGIHHIKRKRREGEQQQGSNRSGPGARAGDQGHSPTDARMGQQKALPKCPMGKKITRAASFWALQCQAAWEKWN